jgi:DNA-directed RNA polymerase II subunit RPB2
MDKTMYVSSYMMRPLVDTKLMDILKCYKVPCGYNMIVAIMSYTGYNQEDSILINEGSIKRGLALTTVYHTDKDEDKQKTSGDEEIYCKPDSQTTKGMKMANYEKLNAKGMIQKNIRVENRDMIMGKVVSIKENKNDVSKVIKYEDRSKMFRGTDEEHYINEISIGTNGDGYRYEKIQTRTLRRPVVGDKFSSRHGQKGTVGCVVKEEDMPFTENGLRPDIIINPHAIPSRMTIGHLVETILGKVLLELGLFGDGTPYNDEFEIKNICELLQANGMHSRGNEIMYNGQTGEQLDGNIFIGTTFYQRLKHMVSDKAHYRANGPMVHLTRQPAEGRSRDGGLRFGEMEKDCTVAHGASSMTRDRLYYSSDSYKVNICRQCGQIAMYNENKHINMCKYCDNNSNFGMVEMPYAEKLLMQELASMNVSMRMMIENA